MWSTKKKTIKVFFVLTDSRTDINDMSETMQLALQVNDDIQYYHLVIEPVLQNILYNFCSRIVRITNLLQL